MISVPKTWLLSLTLRNADENSIWGKLYRKKMDEESFLSFKDGAETIIDDGKVALLQNGEELRYFDEYHCKVSKRRIRQ